MSEITVNGVKISFSIRSRGGFPRSEFDIYADREDGKPLTSYDQEKIMDSIERRINRRGENARNNP